ncbi:MAG: LysM domain-containing protein, partial [Bacteroidota bacterium]
MRIFLISIFILCPSGFIQGHAQDSTRIKTIDGKEFIEHRVQEKETLYSLSRKYDVPIYKIIELNPPTEFGLEIGTTINVPIIKSETAESRTEQEEQLLKS